MKNQRPLLLPTWDSGDARSARDADDHEIPRPALPALLCFDWRTARAHFERAYFDRLLKRSGGNMRRAADVAGVSAPGLYKIVRRLGIRRR